MRPEILPRADQAWSPCRRIDDDSTNDYD